MAKEKEKKQKEEAKIAEASKPLKKVSKTSENCHDVDCPSHGSLKTRGRVFEGKVIRKFHKRVTIEFERMIYIKKYERYAKSRTKVHARLPICMEEGINIGDLIKVKECRPLSKIIHFVVINKIEEKEK
jgi:small subunit ribosomal protein S17